MANKAVKYKKEYKMKHKAGSLVKIYEDTPTFVDGAVAIVLDFDKFNNAYLVADLQAHGKENGNKALLIKNHSKWVSPENFEAFSLKRPKDFSLMHKVFLWTWVSMAILGIFKFFIV